ncbi:zinc finger, CCHC-type containing protein [Tanacetum coccineum]
MRLRLFQFSLRDQASNWLERLPAGSISIWEDLTTHFLAQFFPSGRTSKLQNDILIFQQHQGEYLSEAWTRFKDLLQKVPHHSIDLWFQVQIFYDHVNPTTRRTIDQVVGEHQKALEDEIKDLHLNLLVLEVIAHPPIYNVILDKYVESLELGKNRSGDSKPFDTLADLGSYVNLIPLYLFKKLKIGLLEETDHVFLGIAEDVLVEIAGYIYPVDFVILDVKEDKKKPFILGTTFLAMAKAEISFDKEIITLKSGKNKINFFKIPESLCRVEEGTKSDIDPVAPTTTVSRLILEWEERIKLHQEKEMEFNQ